MNTDYKKTLQYTLQRMNIIFIVWHISSGALGRCLVIFCTFIIIGEQIALHLFLYDYALYPYDFIKDAAIRVFHIVILIASVVRLCVLV